MTSLSITNSDFFFSDFDKLNILDTIRNKFGDVAMVGDGINDAPALARANIGIALISEYWNQGIGTRMFEEMIRLAEEREDLLQMELEFIEGNARARHLYEKMGFRITGVQPNAIRLKDGTLLNSYYMVREIKR